GRLSADDRTLPTRGPSPGPRADGQADRHDQHRCPERTGRGHHARPHVEERAADVLAYFDRPGTSNGPTEAINGRLEHLRGSALGFRNLTNYTARSLLETGGFRHALHPALVKSRSSWGRPKIRRKPATSDIELKLPQVRCGGG